MSLTHLPAGDITLRIQEYRLLVVITSPPSPSAVPPPAPKHGHGAVTAYGEIQLPSYVCTNSLHFKYCEERDALVMLGRAKSYGISVSDDDLRRTTAAAAATTTTSSTHQHQQQVSPSIRHKHRKAMLQTIWSTDAPPTCESPNKAAAACDVTASNNVDVASNRGDVIIANPDVTRLTGGSKKSSLPRQALFRERCFTK